MSNVKNEGDTTTTTTNNNNNNNSKGNWDHLKSSREYPNNIPEKHEIKELQQTSPQGTAHMLWKVLI